MNWQWLVCVPIAILEVAVLFVLVRHFEDDIAAWLGGVAGRLRGASGRGQLSENDRLPPPPTPDRESPQA